MTQLSSIGLLGMKKRLIVLGLAILLLGLLASAIALAFSNETMSTLSDYKNMPEELIPPQALTNRKY